MIFLVFSSIEFLLIFLPIFLIVYVLTPNPFKNGVLLAGSLLFYALGAPRYLVILMLSVLMNFLFGKLLGERVHRRGKGKLLLGVAVFLNVSVLVVCKYLWKELPLGISFYTFQVISYLVDVCRTEIDGETNFVRFATYITMFPRVVSGPIVKYGEVRDDLLYREFTPGGFEDGMKLFTVGLAAKVLLADRLGFLWQEVQVTGFESISTALSWMAAAAYSLKIYFDFAGYSLMAVGLGRIFGFELPRNFNHPYMALSVREFYHRWHMTLGNWFKQYVYIPLGGNRKGGLRTIFNLFLVWILTAFWHGETANFLLWGMILWLLITIEKGMAALGTGKLLEYRMVRLLVHVLVPVVIALTWICFAITDLSQLQVYLMRMFGIGDGIRVSAGDWLRAWKNYWYLFAAGAVACTPLLEKIYLRWKNRIWFSTLLAVLFWFCVWRVRVEGNNPFMYSGF